MSITNRLDPRGNPVDRTALSVAFTVGLYGAAFGAAGVTAGFSVLQTCLLSLFLFSGASQFAVVGIMGAVFASATLTSTFEYRSRKESLVSWSKRLIET